MAEIKLKENDIIVIKNSSKMFINVLNKLVPINYGVDYSADNVERNVQLIFKKGIAMQEDVLTEINEDGDVIHKFVKKPITDVSLIKNRYIIKTNNGYYFIKLGKNYYECSVKDYLDNDYLDDSLCYLLTTIKQVTDYIKFN